MKVVINQPEDKKPTGSVLDKVEPPKLDPNVDPLGSVTPADVDPQKKVEPETKVEPADPAPPSVPGNIFALTLKEFKRRGLISDEVDIDDENENPDSFITKIEGDVIERYKNEGYKQGYQQLAKEVGGEDILLQAKALNQGAKIEQLSPLVAMRELAMIGDDVSRTAKVDAVRQMFVFKKMEQDEIAKLTNFPDTDEGNADLDTQFAKAKSYFKTNYKNWQEQTKKQQQAEEAQNQRIRQRNMSILNAIFTTGKIGEHTLDKQQRKKFREAIYTASEVIEDGQGNKAQASAYQKFDYLWNTDMLFRLDLFRQYLFQEEDLKEMRNRVKEEAEENILNQLQSKTPGVDNTVSNKKEKDKNSEKSGTSQTFYVRTSV